MLDTPYCCLSSWVGGKRTWARFFGLTTCAFIRFISVQRRGNLLVTAYLKLFFPGVFSGFLFPAFSFQFISSWRTMQFSKLSQTFCASFFLFLFSHFLFLFILLWMWSTVSPGQTSSAQCLSPVTFHFQHSLLAAENIIYTW